MFKEFLLANWFFGCCIISLDAQLNVALNVALKPGEMTWRRVEAGWCLSESPGTLRLNMSTVTADGIPSRRVLRARVRQRQLAKQIKIELQEQLGKAAQNFSLHCY
jgi:hypothetical protein